MEKEQQARVLQQPPLRRDDRDFSFAARLHTNYVLPFGYQDGRFLSFLVQEYGTPSGRGSSRPILVTRLALGFNHPAFQRGSR